MRVRQRSFRGLVFAAWIAIASAAQGAPIIFFGEDAGAGDPFNTRVAHPNSDAARSNFLANLVGVGTHDFEGNTAGDTPPLPLTFPGSAGNITATLEGAGEVTNLASGSDAGRYPISGDQFWNLVDSNFSISFDAPVAAFGFYATDVGDFIGQLTLTRSDGFVQTMIIPHTLAGPSGSVLYFGIIDRENPFTQVEFGNTGSGMFGDDRFGFDDLTIGDVAQVVPAPVPGAAVPEPASLAVWTLLSVLGVAFAWRRHGC